MGIQNRYLREQQEWQPHLQKTKQSILDFAETLPQKKSIAVLGSGWLFDVPLESLSNLFQSVYLYDIVHPEQIVVRTSHFPNVHLVTYDLTGGAVTLAKNSEHYSDFIATLQTLTLDVDFNQYDAVVSVNILNQLDIILCDYLSKKFSLSETDLLQVRQTIQQNHVNCLPKGKTCLITDVEEQNISVADGKKENTALIYCDLPTSLIQREWIWTFDTNQTYRKGKRTYMKVNAIHL